jgi:hypothetical protein
MMNAPTGPHADHDRTFVSAHVAGDLSGPERSRAEALVRDCADCSQLAVELRAIRVATAGLPAPARPRTFVLTPADAARLRQAGWRRLATALAGPRAAFTRPLAAGLMAVGLFGLVATSLPNVVNVDLGGAGAGSPSAAETDADQERDGSQPAAAPSLDAAPAPTARANGTASTPPGDTLGGEGFGARSTVGPDTAVGYEPNAAGPTVGPTDHFAALESDSAADVRGEDPDRTVAVLFGSLAIVGFGLLMLRWLAGRIVTG